MPTTRKPIRLLPYKHTSGLFLRDGEYIADIKPDSGGRTIRKLGSDRDRAFKLFDALLAELGDITGDNPLLATFLVETFLPTQLRLRSYAFSKTCVRGVVRFLDATQPSLRLREVGPHHVERLRAFYSERAHAPRTLNMYAQKLSQALNLAVDLGILDANPVARVKPLTVDNRRTRFLSMDDFVRIVHAARDTDARDLLLVVGLSGLRPSNVRLLVVREVDGAVLRIPGDKMKNKRQGIVPVSGYVADKLATLSEGKEPGALLFPARGFSDRPKSMRNLSRSYHSLVGRLAGLEWSTLYDLRHFFASQLAKQGANEQQIGRLLCHVGQSVTSRYVHHDIEDLRHFVDDLSERFVAVAGVPVLSAVVSDRDRVTI